MPVQSSLEKGWKCTTGKQSRREVNTAAFSPALQENYISLLMYALKKVLEKNEKGFRKNLH